MKHYGFSSHVNVLIGENKHWLFKKNVYNINFINVKRFFLLRENLQQIIRLLLSKSFVTIESKLIIMIEKFCEICFALFNTLLLKSKQQQFVENDDYLTIQTNDKYHKFAMLTYLQVKYCKNTLKLSIRFSQLNEHQIRELRKTNEIDYNMFNVMHFESNKIS